MVGEENIFIDLDEREFLRTDSQSTANYLKTLKEAGIITTNECRVQLGLGKIEGGDSLVIPYTDINQNTVGDKPGEEKDEKEEEKPAKRGRKSKSAEEK